MNIILKISLRNLVRQKRRNILLGIGIGFGMGFLVIANAFGSGLADLFLNKMVENISGHIKVQRLEKDKKTYKIIRDKERARQYILDNIEDVKAIHEFVRARGKVLGNGKSLSGTVNGVAPDDGFYRDTEIVAGNLADFKNATIENPIAMDEHTAAELNVWVNDMIHMKFQTVYGQPQTARFTVVAIIKSGYSLAMMMYCPLDQLKPLLGYQEHETSIFNIILKHMDSPQRFIEQANRLHEALLAGAASYIGIVRHNENEFRVTVLAIVPDQASRQLFKSRIHLMDGVLEDIWEDEHTALISHTIAEALHVNVGERISLSYVTRFEGISSPQEYRIGAIFRDNDDVTQDMMFIPAEQMYQTFFPSPPQHTRNISHKSALFPALIKEYTLLERTLTRRASIKKYKALSLSWRGAILDVQTLQEFAPELIEFAGALTTFTIVGVVLLFFIIQIGVVNTLRMTIHERTREIGTIRAIGMQRSDVRWCFVTEVVLLTLFASLIGIGIALLVIDVLSAIPIDAGGTEFSAFLINKRLHLVTNVSDVIRNLAIILCVAFITAYFPSGRAANLSVAKALEHYE